MHGNFGQVVSSAEAMLSCVFILFFGAVVLCGTGSGQLPVVLRNLALAAAQGTSAHCMVIDPLPFSAPDEQVRAAIRPFSEAGLPFATGAAEGMCYAPRP